LLMKRHERVAVLFEGQERQKVITSRFELETLSELDVKDT